MNYVKLELDKPIIVALKYPTGKPVKGFHGPELRWILTNDQALYTPVQVQEQIAGLKIKAGQRFQIERGKNGWKVSHPQAQPQPAAAILDAQPSLDSPADEIPHSRLEDALRNAVTAAAAAEKHAEKLGYACRFSSADVRAMAISVLIGMQQRAA